MKFVVGSMVSAAVLAASAPAAFPMNGASASLSPASPGSRSTLSLTLRYDMQCGQPGPGSVTIAVPSRMQLTPAVGVQIGASPIAGAAVSGHTVTFQIPRKGGVTCMVIAPGWVTFRLVGVRNPSSAGLYTVRAHVRDMDFAAQVAVRA